ncbi:hypothetical protein I79_021502 [Cricetulus griseus]|uniref:Uncharacterized protein n=1 Tax=Cricetulus griseus TaxID=10029 RepID=G3ICU9_CRIGR|nr:hypothetical protein I79_021502 [Cricetulus griseus]
MGLKPVPWVIEECHDMLVKPVHDHSSGWPHPAQLLRQPAALYLNNYPFLF